MGKLLALPFILMAAIPIKNLDFMIFSPAVSGQLDSNVGFAEANIRLDR